MSPAPSFRFLQLPDGLTKREEEYCIQLVKELTNQHSYGKACEIAESLAQNFIDVRAASRKGPTFNLIITALPMGVTQFSLDRKSGEMTFALSDAIHTDELKAIKAVLNPTQIEISGDRQTVSLSWN